MKYGAPILHLQTAFMFQLLWEQKKTVHGERLCSFLLFFCLPLSCFAFSQMPKISGFHAPWQDSTPQGKISKLSVLHTHHHLLRNCPVLSPTHPSTDKQPSPHVSLQHEMEKPAVKATDATVDLAIGRNRSEGERRPLKLCSLCYYFYYRRP